MFHQQNINVKNFALVLQGDNFAHYESNYMSKTVIQIQDIYVTLYVREIRKYCRNNSKLEAVFHFMDSQN